MYVIEHALRNLYKSPGRNILLGAIIFAIITATSVSLAIYNTSGHIAGEVLTALKCAVRAAPRMQAITAGQNQADAAVTLDMYLLFAESEYLDGADIRESGRGADGVDAVYYLRQPSMLAAFETEMRGKGLPDDYIVRTDEATFDSVMGPVESLNSLSLIFLIIVVALGAGIMALLSAIAIRERKYEVGVLRAMGMKKKYVALGLCIEIITVTCICYALGMCAGAALSQPVSDSMMSWQAQPTALQSSSLADRLDEPGAERLGGIDIFVSGATALQIFGISILLASIAAVASVGLITKSEPIKILMERN